MIGLQGQVVEDVCFNKLKSDFRISPVLEANQIIHNLDELNVKNPPIGGFLLEH